LSSDAESNDGAPGSGGESPPEGAAPASSSERAGDGAPPVDPPGEPPSGGWLREVVSNPAYRFVFLFLVYLGALAVFYPRLKVRYPAILDVMAWGTAQIEAAVMGLFSSLVSVDDKVVIFDGFAVKIIEECTGIYEILIFAAAVVAFPTSWARKGIGLALGAPLLYLFNVMRILVLILVGRFYPASFDFMHLYFWQATLILMITSVWLLWIVKVVQYEPNDSVPA